jgi:hypothetical protein
VSGGTSYQWYRDGVKLEGATAATYQATQTGTYTADIITATCSGKASNQSVITQGTAPTGQITPATGTLCGTGSTVSLSVSGGTSYQWYRDGVKLEGATGATYQATQTGTYTADIITATCSGKASNSSVVSVSTPLAFDIIATQPNCTTATGSLVVSSLSGGSGAGFTYSKDGGVTFQNESTFSNLNAGSYTIVVKDGAGCKSNPKNAVINSFASTLKATASVTNNTSCLQSTGSVSIRRHGGTSPYQYSIDGGTAQTTNVFTGLAVGPHKVVIKDAAGCTDEVSFTVTQLNSTLSGTATVTNVICDKKGSVSIQATGGVAPYTFSLNGGTFQSSSLFDNLASGQQKVTIKDNLGCVFEVAFEVKQTGGSPTLLITDPPAICPGATLNLKDPSLTKGSEAGLSFTYWTDANATIPVADPTAVTAGRYYIRAMNDVGCSVIKPVVITAISSPAGSVIFSGTPFACTGQVIILTASTGTAYQWYRNDTAIAGATLQIYRATTDGPLFSWYQ